MRTQRILVLSEWLIWIWRRVYFVPGSREIITRYGWPFLGLWIGSRTHQAAAFTALAERLVVTGSDRSRKEYYAYLLEGQRQFLLRTIAWQRRELGRPSMMAVALMVGVPFIEESGRRVGDKTLLAEVLGVMHDEVPAGALAAPVAGILGANLTLAAGLVAGYWSAGAVVAMCWFDACALILVTALHGARFDWGRNFRPLLQHVIALLAAAAVVFAMYKGGELFLTMPAEVLAAFMKTRSEMPGVFTVRLHQSALQALSSGVAWIAIVAFIAMHALSFAFDVRRREFASEWRMRHLIGVTIYRCFLTVLLVAVVIAFPHKVTVYGLAIAVAARGLFEAWGHTLTHAPLWWSGQLQLMQAARAAHGAQR
jgi:hypothetical protein